MKKHRKTEVVHNLKDEFQLLPSYIHVVQQIRHSIPHGVHLAPALAAVRRVALGLLRHDTDQGLVLQDLSFAVRTVTHFQPLLALWRPNEEVEAPRVGAVFRCDVQILELV